MPEINNFRNTFRHAIQFDHRISKYFMDNIFKHTLTFWQNGPSTAQQCKNESQRLFQENHQYLQNWSIGLNAAQKKQWTTELNTTYHNGLITFDVKNYNDTLYELMLTLLNHHEIQIAQQKLKHQNWDSEQLNFVPNVRHPNVYLKYYYQSSKHWETIYLKILNQKSNP